MKDHRPTRRAFIAALAAGAARPASAVSRPALDPPHLLLALNAPADVDSVGYLVSEKYDGARACRDGAKLRFRGGERVAAPAWFTAGLPDIALDGELWLGRGRFEALVGAARRLQPDEAEWRALRDMVFELPGARGDFAEHMARIEALVRGLGHPSAVAAPQRPLAHRAALRRRLDDVVRGGGEGLMLHRADALYVGGPQRGAVQTRAGAGRRGHLAGSCRRPRP
jgi:DNA ligase-1